MSTAARGFAVYCCHDNHLAKDNAETIRLFPTMLIRSDVFDKSLIPSHFSTFRADIINESPNTERTSSRLPACVSVRYRGGVCGVVSLCMAITNHFCFACASKSSTSAYCASKLFDLVNVCNHERNNNELRDAFFVGDALVFISIVM